MNSELLTDLVKAAQDSFATYKDATDGDGKIDFTDLSEDLTEIARDLGFPIPDDLVIDAIKVSFRKKQA